MKINRKKAVAVAVAAIMSCGIFAGCDLVIRNEKKNLAQTVATVNIAKSDNFKKEFKDLDDDLVAKVITSASVSKRDLIATFINSGYSNANVNYADLFNAISESLAQRQISIQYAKAYFLANGWQDEEDNKKPYTYNDLAAFNEAVKDKSGVDYDIAATAYFLTDEEIKKADYTTRVLFNNSVDSYEDRFIKKEEDDKEYDSEVRTTPSGLNTSDSDYYSEDYRVYTGTGKQSGVHVYEPKDGSTATTRLRGYNEFLSDLEANGLVQKGDDTSDIESLEYFKREKKSDYEDALIQKLIDVFSKQAEETITETYLTDNFNETLENQSNIYQKSSSALESDLDSVSDSKFVLTATGNSDEESAFGFVINILLPFSAAQTDELNSVTQDFGDTKGNKFATRAQLLKKIKATDQRGSWFRGETDYSFKATADVGAYGYNTTDDSKPKREWLFFEDNFNDSNEPSKYKRLKNYYGKYTYNGTWNEELRKYKPNQITIDGFINEMEGYLESAGATVQKGTPLGDSYYSTDPKNYYKTNGDVDYGKFVYYKGKVTFDGGFNANQMFKAGTPENTAMSVINELSFAYNTDKGGLNSYLGYAVTANKTSFVSEFEYAAQKVVKEGAGNYIVVPSDYGWHIIYCTFSFVDGKDNGSGIRTPFEFNYRLIKDEGTFSNLYYEAHKADTASKDSTNRHSLIVSYYKESATIYEDRYSDLANLGNN